MQRSNYQLKLFPSAEYDLEEISDYLAEESIFAAKKIILKFEKTFDNLIKFPLIGKIYEEIKLPYRGYRYVVVDNYLIFYKIENNSINIYRIIHGARDYKSLL